MISLSKSKYCALWQCPKMAWLYKFKANERNTDDATKRRMDAGIEVGKLAKSLFGAYVDVAVYNNGKPNIPRMIDCTKREMAGDASVICEASFDYNGLYCAVDLLKAEDGGWAIYEVKSSTNSDKNIDVYLADISYQKYVLEHCGVKVAGTYLVRLNSNYVRNGDLNIEKLFDVLDVSDVIKNEEALIEPNLAIGERILNCDREPEIDISEACRAANGCEYWKYCTADLPNPSVFNLYRLPFKKMLDAYRKGLACYEDYYNSGLENNEKRLRQIEFHLNDLPMYADKPAVGTFLEKLSYPLYFLDFETMQDPIPRYDGIRPYQQIPFQYSLHYIERDGGILKHKEFLGQSGTDTRRALAEQLCQDIPMHVCVTAYNKAFECGRLRELSEAFPDLSAHLLNIESNIVDLLEPFQSGYVYNKEMGGSFSIKSVLPALFPGDPALDYHNLDGVHNGTEAMTIFPSIKDMKKEDADEARRNLLKYCELDTYAMVKVWEKLEELK